MKKQGVRMRRRIASRRDARCCVYRSFPAGRKMNFSIGFIFSQSCYYYCPGDVHCSSGTVHFRTDAVRFHTDRLHFRADAVRFCTDRLRFRTDAVRFRTDRLHFRTDAVRFCTDSMRFRTDAVHCSPGQMHFRRDRTHFRPDGTVSGQTQYVAKNAVLIKNPPRQRVYRSVRRCHSAQ